MFQELHVWLEWKTSSSFITASLPEHILCQRCVLIGHQFLCSLDMFHITVLLALACVSVQSLHPWKPAFEGPSQFKGCFKMPLKCLLLLANSESRYDPWQPPISQDNLRTAAKHSWELTKMVASTVKETFEFSFSNFT